MIRDVFVLGKLDFDRVHVRLLVEVARAGSGKNLMARAQDEYSSHVALQQPICFQATTQKN
jgi:hypothetical protein